MKEIVSDSERVAFCGLYCGACGRYLRGKCQGCRDNNSAGWCKVRTCNLNHGYSSCAECKDFPDPNDCKLFNNFVSRLFALVFRSDRAGCIAQIRELGIQGHADRMAESRRHSLKR
jgi:Protein of unknown function (DUF3795)